MSAAAPAPIASIVLVLMPPVIDACAGADGATCTAAGPAGVCTIATGDDGARGSAGMTAAGPVGVWITAGTAAAGAAAAGALGAACGTHDGGSVSTCPTFHGVIAVLDAFRPEPGYASSFHRVQLFTTACDTVDGHSFLSIVHSVGLVSLPRPLRTPCVEPRRGLPPRTPSADIAQNHPFFLPMTASPIASTPPPIIAHVLPPIMLACAVSTGTGAGALGGR